MPTQLDWRFCQRCNAMFYDGLPGKFFCAGAPMPLPGHDGHEAQGYVFDLPYDQQETPNIQTGWGQCGKCGVLFFEGAATKTCVAGGNHEAQGYNFALTHDVPEADGTQAAWRFCVNCSAMFFDGFPTKGACPGNVIGRTRELRPLRGGHEPSGFVFVLPHTGAPAPAGDKLHVQFTGPVWLVSLTHQQTQTLGTIVTDAAPALAEGVGAAIKGAAQIIAAIDLIGGNNGVDVQGVLGVSGVIVTPRGSGIIGRLIEGVNHGVTAAWIVDFLLLTAHAVPSVGTDLGIATAANVLSSVMGGISVGTALAVALGIDVSGLLSPPDPNAHGGIHADRKFPPQQWEQFFMSQIGPNGQIALLSWQGLFSAQGGGGADVYANRPQLGDWEKWMLIQHPDSTFSFLTSDGKHYLTATNGGGDGSVCWANADATRPPGDPEKFVIEAQTNGRIAIRTHAGTYLSVQSGK